jgi:hypothetical protein
MQWPAGFVFTEFYPAAAGQAANIAAPRNLPPEWPKSAEICEKSGAQRYFSPIS